MILVIVTGHPASGKTTLARRLAVDLNLPCLTKDDIKESLFDTLGWSDRAWSKKLGIATYALIELFVEIQVRAGRSVLVEFNFDAAVTTPHYQKIQAQYNFYPIQIVLDADADILLQRFIHRTESGERHPGNADRTVYEEYRERLAKGPYQPLDIGGTIIRTDTNDFSKLDYDALLHHTQREIEIHQTLTSKF